MTAYQRDHPKQYAASMAALNPNAKPAAPESPSAEELAKPAHIRGYFTHAEMKALSEADVQRLSTERPEFYQRSLDMLAATKVTPRASVTDLLEA
jgi:hypothetical protein